MQELGEESLGSPTGSWKSLEYEIRAWNVSDKLLKKLGVYTLEYVKYKYYCLRSHFTFPIKSRTKV